LTGVNVKRLDGTYDIIAKVNADHSVYEDNRTRSFIAGYYWFGSVINNSVFHNPAYIRRYFLFYFSAELLFVLILVSSLIDAIGVNL